jgi:hypothetical protein
VIAATVAGFTLGPSPHKISAACSPVRPEACRRPVFIVLKEQNPVVIPVLAAVA